MIQRLAFPAVVTLCVLLGGCIDASYDKLKIGQQPRDYDKTLPMEFTRRTDLGLAYLEKSSDGRTDAIVVLLTTDRRVAGKLHAIYVERGGLMGVQRGYRLTGQLDPYLAETSTAGPVDTLRSLVTELLSYRGERMAMDAHAWVAVGLVRLMQRWPGVTDVGVDTQPLTAWLEQVPGGGQGEIAVDSSGAYNFRYSTGSVK